MEHRFELLSKNKIKLPTINRVLTAGAPVPPNVLKNVRSIISSDGDVFTPYGATEALPVACNSATEVLQETASMTNQGMGTCVGKKFERIDWRVIKITDQPLNDIDQTTEVDRGHIGELMVKGPAVTDQYVTRTDANADHKVRDEIASWHRMGDVGYFDDQDRFWFCGRKSHRVRTSDGTLYTVRCEAIFNTHASIYRSALVGVGEPGRQIPVIVAEPKPDRWPKSESERRTLIDELTSLGQNNPLTESIAHVLLKQALPVDIRHNSKIFREQIQPWAAEQIAKGQSA